MAADATSELRRLAAELAAAQEAQRTAELRAGPAPAVSAAATYVIREFVFVLFCCVLPCYWRG